MTKKKILIASCKLFYEHGIANVRLQQIADGANISVGNLAYHYKNKEAIVTAIYETVFHEMKHFLDGEIPSQDLAHFDNTLKSLFKLNNQFNFCFINVWEIARNYPDLQAQWESINNTLLTLISKRFDIYTAQGIFKEEPYKGAYKILANHVLLNILSWVPYQLLSGRPATFSSFKKSVWALIVPHLSQKGHSEYNTLLNS